MIPVVSLLTHAPEPQDREPRWCRPKDTQFAAQNDDESPSKSWWWEGRKCLGGGSGESARGQAGHSSSNPTFLSGMSECPFP